METHSSIAIAMPKILYFCTEDWAFLLHFIPMARAARAAGFEVVIATRVRTRERELAAVADRIIHLENDRRSLGALEILRSVRRMFAIVRAERPDLVHCIGLRMVVLAGLASRVARARRMILAPTGLGYLWLEDGIVARLGRVVTQFVVRRLLRGPHIRFLFENPDDPREFGLDPHGGEVQLVGGTGVDPATHPATAEPASPPVTTCIVSRMLRTKGIREAVAAVRRARAQGADVELHLYGAPDPANRTTCTEAELKAWTAEPGIVWHGPVRHPADAYGAHHVAMLLSYREGLPKTLIEAAACARPIVATDVQGCREVARDGVEGFLVPVRDAEKAAEALIALARDAALRTRMGRAAHARFLERFTETAVMKTVGDLYRDAVTDRKSAGTVRR